MEDIEQKLIQISVEFEGFVWSKEESYYLFKFYFPEVENNDSEDYLFLKEALEDQGFDLSETCLEHDCYSGCLCLKSN